jgi:diaminopimelate decarboxylase
LPAVGLFSAFGTLIKIFVNNKTFVAVHRSHLTTRLIRPSSKFGVEADTFVAVCRSHLTTRLIRPSSKFGVEAAAQSQIDNLQIHV